VVGAGSLVGTWVSSDGVDAVRDPLGVPVVSAVVVDLVADVVVVVGVADVDVGVVFLLRAVVAGAGGAASLDRLVLDVPVPVLAATVGSGGLTKR
jgi:hypothetical protein